MLKTSLEVTSEPDVLLISKGILKGYIRNVNLFLLGMVLSLLRAKRKIHKNLPEDIKKLLALTIAMYGQLRKQMGKEEALSLVKAVVIPIGLIKQYGFFRFVEEPDHSFANMIRFSKRFKDEGPMRLNKMEITRETDARYEFQVRNCVFKKVYDDFGYPELLNIFCAVDNALYNSYSPDSVTFSRGAPGKTIAHGNKTCDFVCAKWG